MKTLIVYSSKYGGTTKAISKLKEYLKGDIKSFNLNSENLDVKLDNYDNIIIGSSIYAGKINKKVDNFCNDNLSVILQKRVGLFICCGNEDKAFKQLEESFNNKILNQSIIKGYFGYEYNFDKMNFVFKMIVKKLSGVKKSRSVIRENNIEKFAYKFNGGDVSWKI